MTKKVTLKQIGWTLTGHAIIKYWGGGKGMVQMDESFIPFGKMTKSNFHRCINDGQFGCEGIEFAEVYIYDQYEGDYREFNRAIRVDRPNPRLVCRGI